MVSTGRKPSRTRGVPSGVDAADGNLEFITVENAFHPAVAHVDDAVGRH